MTRIKLVVSDVDGTLVTKDKTLTDAAKSAVRRLRDAGVGFTIVSSRPAIGMGFLIEPLDITLPVGAFNGSSIIDPSLKPIEQHLIQVDVTRRSLDVLKQFGVDIWLFTNEKWLTRNPDGAYVGHEKLAIRHDPTIVPDFAPYIAAACKIVGSSPDPALLQRCEAEMQQAVGAQSRFPPTPLPPSVTCRTIWPCFERAASRSRWATRPTTSRRWRRGSRARMRKRDLRERSRWF